MKGIPVAVLRRSCILSRTPSAERPAAARAVLAANGAGVPVTTLIVPSLLGRVPVAPVVFGCGDVAFGAGLLRLLLHRGRHEGQAPSAEGAAEQASRTGREDADAPGLHRGLVRPSPAHDGRRRPE